MLEHITPQGKLNRTWVHYHKFKMKCALRSAQLLHREFKLNVLVGGGVLGKLSIAASRNSYKSCNHGAIYRNILIHTRVKYTC